MVRSKIRDLCITRFVSRDGGIYPRLLLLLPFILSLLRTLFDYSRDFFLFHPSPHSHDPNPSVKEMTNIIFLWIHTFKFIPSVKLSLDCRESVGRTPIFFSRSPFPFVFVFSALQPHTDSLTPADLSTSFYTLPLSSPFPQITVSHPLGGQSPDTNSSVLSPWRLVSLYGRFLTESEDGDGGKDSDPRIGPGRGNPQDQTRRTPVSYEGNRTDSCFSRRPLLGM